MPAPSPLARRGVGGVLVNTGPLRRHPGFRRLWTGQLIASLGSQLTVVAVAYQTYRLTGSTAVVGLVSLSGLVPLLAGSVLGGPAVDAWDRRKVLLVTQVLLAVGAAGLAVNAMLGHPLLWPMFACTAEAALFQSVDWAARRASLRQLVPAAELPAALSVQSAAFQATLVVGPAAAGLAHRPRRLRAGLLAERHLFRGGVHHRGQAAGAPARGRRGAGRAGLPHRRDPVSEVERAAGRGLPHRPRRDGVRDAAGALPGDGGDRLPRGRHHRRVPERGTRAGRPDRLPAHWSCRPGPAGRPGGGGLRRGLGPCDHRLRAGALAARRTAAAGPGRRGRRGVIGVSDDHRAAVCPGRHAGTDQQPGVRRSAGWPAAGGRRGGPGRRSCRTAGRCLVRRPAQRGVRDRHVLGDPAVLAVPEHHRAGQGAAWGAAHQARSAGEAEPEPGLASGQAQPAGEAGAAAGGAGGPGLTRQS